VWNVPGWGTPDADRLDMVAAVLANGKTSRLFKRLVYDDQIATNVQTYMDSREIGSLFTIVANAKPNVELATIEKAVDEELQRLIKDGPTEAEVDRVRTQTLAGFIRGSERIGGFGGKSDILAKGLVFRGDPQAYKASLELVRTATPADLREAAATWLSDGVYALEITPFPQYTNASNGADRSKVPDAGSPPTAALPKVEKATLSNGLQIVLAHREAVPVGEPVAAAGGGIRLRSVRDAGHGLPGHEHARRGNLHPERPADQRGAAAPGRHPQHGGQPRPGHGGHVALKANLGPSLDILSDVVLHPSFPEEDFQRLKQQRLAQIRQEKSSPVAMGLRVFPPLIFGAGHAYGLPFTGSGYEDTVTKMDRAAMVKYHQTWFKPNHSTLRGGGDTSMAELKPMLEDRFKSWGKGDVPEKNLAQVKIPDKAVVYLVDKPGALQSVILAGHVAPPTNNPDEIAIQTLNTILGGSFTSRLNMNLREDKHWSYGAGSFFVDARGQRPFLAYAPVQTDKTKESVAEVAKELKDLVNGRPATDDELSKAKDNQTLTWPGSGRRRTPWPAPSPTSSATGSPRTTSRPSPPRCVRSTWGASPAPPRSCTGQADLGDRGRPGQDRVRHPRAEPGRDQVPGRRRQAGVVAPTEEARPPARQRRGGGFSGRYLVNL
jgi:zinc protease